MPIVLDTLAGGTGGGGRVCSYTRINNCWSVDSDDDFRWGYRNVSHYYWLPSVTASQEYSYLEDQTKRSKDTLVFKPLTV